ncbi:MAG: sporulation initiation factor Spo0A C-terminal domain-containing protein [Ruminococcus sp.]|nr:sporulation initiation factor Spo0A C-terminal domain-containing protein [Ruminococcus sp.]
MAWERGDLDMIQSLFGYTIDSYKGHPTNYEFIALLTDRLVLKYGNFSDFRLVSMKK